MYKYKHSKTSCPNLCHVQKHYATKVSPQVRIKKRKRLSESRTTLRHNSKALERCENNCARHFWREKKWNTFLMLEFCLKEHGTFWMVSYFLVAERFWQLRTMFILTKFLYYFDLFYNNWKRRIYLYDCIIAKFAVGFSWISRVNVS